MPTESYHPSYGKALRGDCWRAGHEDEKAPGKLTIQRDGRCELTLDEGGTELLSLYADENVPFHAEVLHLRPTPVTVFGHISVGSEAVGIGTADMRCWHYGHVQVHELLYGIHIVDRTAPLGERVVFHADHIHEIFRLDALKIGTRPHRKIKLRFEPPRIEAVQLDDNVALYLQCQLKQHWLLLNQEEITFKQLTRLELRYRAPISLDECKRHITKIQTFLSFCLQIVTFPSDVVLLCRPCKHLSPRRNRSPRWVTFVRRYLVDNGNASTGSRAGGDAKLIDTYIAEGVPTVLNMLRKWWLHYAKLEPVVGLYLSTLSGRMNQKFVEFLLITQALEAYHRRMIGGEYEGRTTFRGGLLCKLVQAIPSDIDLAYRSRIISGLKYLNEYSLRKRLRTLVRRRKNVIAFAFENGDETVNQIVDLRNKFTHYDNAISEVDFVDINLWRSTARAKVLLDSCLLHELGLSEEAAKKAIDICCGRNGAHVLL